MINYVIAVTGKIVEEGIYLLEMEYLVLMTSKYIEYS